MRIGSRYRMMGPTETANLALGSQPVGMKRAVMRPRR
jgi:hypothetical protein